MNPLTRATSLNNAATKSLRHGNASAAVSEYREAIRLLLSSCECSKLEPIDEPSGHHQRSHAKLGEVPVARVSPGFHSEGVTCTYFSTNLYEFHPDDAELPTMNQLVLFSAVTLYNCAVCFHQQGGPACLYKAANLYEQCWGLLSQITVDMGASDIMASVLHNQANICYNLNDFYQARIILDKLFLLTQRDLLLSAAAASGSKCNTVAPEA